MNQLQVIKTLGSETPIIGVESRKKFVAYGDTKRHHLLFGNLKWTYFPPGQCWWSFDGTLVPQVKKLRGIKVITLYVYVKPQPSPRLPFVEPLDEPQYRPQQKQEG